MPEFILGAEIQKDLCLADLNFGGPAANIPMQFLKKKHSHAKFDDGPIDIHTHFHRLPSSALLSPHQSPQPRSAAGSWLAFAALPAWAKVTAASYRPNQSIASIENRAVVASDSLLFLTSKDLHTTSTPACCDPPWVCMCCTTSAGAKRALEQAGIRFVELLTRWYPATTVALVALYI